MTTTSSPRLIDFAISDYLRSKGNDAHELSPELASHWSEYASASRRSVVVEDDDGVFVESQIASVLSPNRRFGPHHHSSHHGTFLDRRVGGTFLDVANNYIAHRGGFLVLTKTPYHPCLFGSGVVGYFNPAAQLDHLLVMLAGLGAGGFLENVNNPPSLEFAEGSRGHYADFIANLAGICFIMGVDDCLSLDFLAIQRVWNLVIEGNFDGLVPRVIGYRSDQFLSVVAFTHLR